MLGGADTRVYLEYLSGSGTELGKLRYDLSKAQHEKHAAEVLQAPELDRLQREINLLLHEKLATTGPEGSLLIAAQKDSELNRNIVARARFEVEVLRTDLAVYLHEYNNVMTEVSCSRI